MVKLEHKYAITAILQTSRINVWNVINGWELTNFQPIFAIDVAKATKNNIVQDVVSGWAVKGSLLSNATPATKAKWNVLNAIDNFSDSIIL